MEETRAALDFAASWTRRAVVRGPQDGAIGLHFGHAGPCWALADAALELGDEELLAWAVERALALPRRWPGPDVTHGLAGLGLTLIRLADDVSDPRLRAASDEVAHLLRASVELVAGVPSWRTDAETTSAFASQTSIGFAHGTAGIATYLLEHARLRNDDASLRLALSAARALVAVGVVEHGSLAWPSAVGDCDLPPPYWCNGAGGVATFLARAAGAAPADLLPGVESSLQSSARSLVGHKWGFGAGQCHGLAGSIETLLDLSTAADDAAARQAGDLARTLWDLRVQDSAGPLVADDIQRPTADYAVGYAGVLSALLRLEHGGRRLWLPGGVR